MTIDQVREAVLNADLGARLVDSGNFLRNADRARVLDSIRVSIVADPMAQEQASLAPGTSTAAALAVPASDPQETAIGDARFFALRVGPTPSPGPGLVTQLMVAGWEMDMGAVGSMGRPARLLPDAQVAPAFPEYVFDEKALDGLTPSSSGFAPDSSIGFHPRIDTLSLSGDFSAGFTLSALPANISRIELAAGYDYVLAIDDDFVGAGHWLIVEGQGVGIANHLRFDGSAETDGRLLVFGSGADDFIFGGAGDDAFRGLGGADVLVGGDGADVFSYLAASESTGGNYDIIADFDPAADRIDLPGAAPGFGAAIAGGLLSEASFDGDLAAALAGLGAGQARWFAPDKGDLAGNVFLVVDGNGAAGYQTGEDYVIAIGGASLAELTGQPAIFI